MPAAMNRPFMNWTKRTSAVRLAITRSPCIIHASPAHSAGEVRGEEGVPALLLVFGADLLDLLLGLQHVLGVGAGHVLEAFERILGIAVGDAGVVRERPLAVEIAHGDVAQQGLVARAAQGGAELGAVGGARLLDRL